MKMHWLFNQYMKPADDGIDGGSGGGDVDRGDNWTPTEDQDHTALKAAQEKAAADAAAAAKAEAEAAAAAKAKKTEDGADAGTEAKTKAEGEGDGDGAADGEGEDGKRKDTRVPLSRHKEILDAERARREAVEKELQKYREGQQIAATNEEITELEDKVIKAEAEYSKLITDGEVDKAAAKMREIRAFEREINDKKTDMRIAAAEARAVEKVRYDALVERMEEAYPQLNPEHEDFDKNKTAEVLDMKAAFQARGYTPTEALQKAIKYVMPPKTKAQTQATEVKPRVDADDAAKAKAAARAEEQRKKNADAATKQPPDLKTIGADSDKMGGGISAKDVMKMSYEDFKKLDDKTLAAMRGDEVEA